MTEGRSARVLLSLFVMSACGAERGDLSWSIRFDPDVDTDRVQRIEARIVRGACDSNEVVYSAQVERGQEVPVPPSLPAGDYAFHGRAQDSDCQWIAQGCTPVSLPKPGSAAVEVVLIGRTPVPACEEARCQAGRCEAEPPADAEARPDAADAGPDACAECAGALSVTAPGGRFRLRTGATSLTGSCGGEGAETLLRLDLEQTADLFVSTHGSVLDTVVYLRACDCTLSDLGCSDDSDGVATSVLQVPGLAAGQYLLVIDSEAGASDVQVDVYLSPPGEPGDRCGNPLPLAPGFVQGNTCAFNSDNSGTGLCAGDREDMDGNDVIYYVVVTGSRELSFDTCQGCTDYDSSLQLRAVCSEESEIVACNDDSCGSDCGDSYTSRARLTEQLEPGLYFLYVDGFGDTCGRYGLLTEGL